MAAPDPATALLETLEALANAAEANIGRARLIRRRIARLQRELEAGKPLVDVLTGEERPLVVELVTENIATLNEVGSRLRWAEAQALRDAGMSVADIARLFGVTRQRVSALLADPPASVGG